MADSKLFQIANEPEAQATGQKLPAMILLLISRAMTAIWLYSGKNIRLV